MFEEARASLLQGGRLTADGMPHSDLLRVGGRISSGLTWHAAWWELSEYYESKAADRSASTVTRGSWLWLASMAAHISQLYWFESEDERQRSELRRSALYRLAAPLLLPAAKEISFDVDGGEEASATGVRGFLRVPEGSAVRPVPCVVLLGGLDSTKEESRLFEELCLARGVATFVFDGPGQGETFPGVPLGVDFAPWVSCAVDVLERCPGVDAGRIGLVGRSLGGTYALSVAPAEPRIRAVVSWSPLARADDFERFPPAVRATFTYAAGGGEPATAALKVVRSIDAVGQAKQPTLLCQGRRDHIVPVSEQEELEAAANGFVEVLTYEDGSHCCHNLAQVVRPQLADWIVARIAEGP